jgi:hypothetical protein
MHVTPHCPSQRPVPTGRSSAGIESQGCRPGTFIALFVIFHNEWFSVSRDSSVSFHCSFLWFLADRSPTSGGGWRGLSDRSSSSLASDTPALWASFIPHGAGQVLDALLNCFVVFHGIPQQRVLKPSLEYGPVHLFVIGAAVKFWKGIRLVVWIRTGKWFEPRA